MCKYSTLCHDNHGYVIKCRSCTNIQVAFRTTALTLSPTQFDEFASLVEKECNAWQDYGFPDLKAIAIPTISRFVNIVCSLNELKRLKQLLQKGKDKLVLDKLFVFHDN